MMHKSYIHNCSDCQLNQKLNMKGLVGGPLFVGGLGPGPPGPPLKSGPEPHFDQLKPNTHRRRDSTSRLDS